MTTGTPIKKENSDPSLTTKHTPGPGQTTTPHKSTPNNNNNNTHKSKSKKSNAIPDSHSDDYDEDENENYNDDDEDDYDVDENNNNSNLLGNGKNARNGQDTSLSSSSSNGGGSSTSGKGEKKKMTEEEKRKSFLERNRIAALKCRQRKKQWLEELQSKVEYYTSENENLNSQLSSARDEILSLKALLFRHKDCSMGIPPETLSALLNDGAVIAAAQKIQPQGSPTSGSSIRGHSYMGQMSTNTSSSPSSSSSSSSVGGSGLPRSHPTSNPYHTQGTLPPSTSTLHQSTSLGSNNVPPGTNAPMTSGGGMITSSSNNRTTNLRNVSSSVFKY